MEPTISHFEDILRNTMWSNHYKNTINRTIIMNDKAEKHISNLPNYSLVTRMYEYLRNHGHEGRVSRAQLFGEATKMRYSAKDIIFAFDELDTYTDIGKIQEDGNIIYIFYVVNETRREQHRKQMEFFNAIPETKKDAVQEAEKKRKTDAKVAEAIRDNFFDEMYQGNLL